MVCFFLPVFYDGISFSLLFFPRLLYLHPLLLKPIYDTKAPGGDRKALTIPLPQTRSTTQTRALLNTNAPNLPQLPIAHVISLGIGLSRWSPCVRNPAAEILRMRTTRETPSTTGPTTVLRLHGKEYYEGQGTSNCKVLMWQKLLPFPGISAILFC